MQQKNDNISLLVINLERRFSALLEHENNTIFTQVFTEYVGYLGRTESLSRIVERLALDNKIKTYNFIELCLSYLGSTIGKDALPLPLFLTEKTERKFKAKEAVLDFLKEKDVNFSIPSLLPWIPSREESIFFIRQLHGLILEELANINNSTENKQTTYDSNKGILVFKGIELDFSRKYNQKDLLRILFTEPQKNWDYDEIQDIWDDKAELLELKREKNYWRRFYTAADEINKWISIETGIKDFIEKNIKQVRINPKYL